MTTLLMGGLLLWTTLGLVGTAVALLRHERARARRGVVWIAAVWGIYVSTLAALSLSQPARIVTPGTDHCFDEMCFAVVGAQELEGFWVRGEQRERLLRVAVRIANHGRAHGERENGLRAYLLDSTGHRWSEVPGLSGVRLDTLVSAGGSTVSEPVFRLPRDVTDLRLVLVHAHLSPSLLVLGDPESWLHRPELMLLPPAQPSAALREEAP